MKKVGENLYLKNLPVNCVLKHITIIMNSC